MFAALFAGAGEEEFRRREEMALREVCQSSPPWPVVACGSGVVEIAGHAGLMTSVGRVLWLDLPLAVIDKRMRELAETVPIFAETMPASLKEG